MIKSFTTTEHAEGVCVSVKFTFLDARVGVESVIHQHDESTKIVGIQGHGSL